MKIGILTQSFKSNYGGLLQAYALQTVLQRMGNNTLFLQRDYTDYNKIPLMGVIRNYQLILLRKIKGLPTYIPSKHAVDTIRKNTDIFVNGYLNKSPYFYSTKQLREYTDKEKFEAYVVGSDQVWRPRFSTNISTFFLDFAEKQDVKRVAYAASFGVDNWEYTKQQEKQCVPLAKMFNAISVREESGISLCEDYMGVKAVHVLDPTLLLDRSDYIKLVEAANEPPKDGTLFCYVLDESKDIKSVIDSIAQQSGLNPFYTMPKLKLSKENEAHHLEDCVFPRVTEWLRSFIDAEMVVTDSFHGCVFSIIFNKPFWVVGNKARGMTRFESLLKLFCLQNRMISNKSFSRINIKAPIDWEYVEKRRSELIDFSLAFLKKGLEA